MRSDRARPLVSLVGLLADGMHHAPHALGVPRLVDRQQRGEVIARARVDEIDAREVPSRDAKTKEKEGAVRGGQLEPDALDGRGAVAAPLVAGDLGAEAAAEIVRARTVATDRRPAEIPLERSLLDLAVLLPVILVLDPRLRGGVEKVEGEGLLALEHRQEASLDLAPERLLLAVLLGRVRQRGVVHDAESAEALDRLGGDHRGAVVREERAGQAALLERLREPVDQGLGGLVEVPLQVAAEPRPVVEDAEQLRLLPHAVSGEHGTRALMEVEVPKAVHVADLERPRLALGEVDAVGMVTFLPRPEEGAALHEATDGGVAGDDAEARVLAREGDEVVVMELERPPRVLAVLARDRLRKSRGDARL